MSTNTFAEEYAAFYDILYQDKDYAGEAKYIDALIKKLKKTSANDLDILDLACGTGKHARELHALGYTKIEGSDFSKDMIEIAKAQNKEKNLSIPYYTESFQTSDKINKKYNVILSLFSSIDYLVKYDEIAKSLQNIKSLLKDDGIFVFDFWNGNEVLRDYSPVRVKHMKEGKKEVRRVTNTTLNKMTQVATLNFKFSLLEDKKIISEFEEVHPVRYFFPQEMQGFLEANGLKLIYSCPFMKLDTAIEPTDWNLTYVVQKVK